MIASRICDSETCICKCIFVVGPDGQTYKPFKNFATSTKDNLYATWFVAAPYKDIADLYVNVRDARNNVPLLERHLSYDTRRVQLAGDEVVGNSSGTAALQLCVQAKSSDGSIGSWFDAQCYALPTDFAAVRSRYSGHYNGVYTMLSSKPPRGAAAKRGSRNSGSQSSNAAWLMVVLPAVCASLRLALL